MFEKLSVHWVFVTSQTIRYLVHWLWIREVLRYLLSFVCSLFHFSKWTFVTFIWLDSLSRPLRPILCDGSLGHIHAEILKILKDWRNSFEHRALHCYWCQHKKYIKISKHQTVLLTIHKWSSHPTVTHVHLNYPNQHLARALVISRLAQLPAE